MLKKIMTAFLFAFILTTAGAAIKTTDPTVTPATPSLEKLYKFKATTVNEIEYWWVLFNDGCYHLFRCEVVGGILEFWTAMNGFNWAGQTTICLPQEEFEVMC